MAGESRGLLGNNQILIWVAVAIVALAIVYFVI